MILSWILIVFECIEFEVLQADGTEPQGNLNTETVV